MSHRMREMMSRSHQKLCGIERFTAWITACIAVCFFCSGVALGADRRPNIVFMLSDDQGWAGLSVPMHPTVSGSRGEMFHTPHLEVLAKQGMRFSWAYSPAPVCSPTRIALQLGKSPAKLHWTKAAPAETGRKLVEPRLIKNIATEEVTIGEMLQKAGYLTAHYGKWHISGGGPGKHGYDEHDGDTGNENAFKFTDPNPVDIFGMVDRSEKFMKRAQEQGKPFFIQLSWNALHASENANKATLAKYEGKNSGGDSKMTSIAAITEDLDSGVGKLMEAIDRLGLAEDTYVIYMSDNGAGGKRGGLNGGKRSLWAGGIRGPLIVRGPGVKPDSWCNQPVVGYDWFPTFCEWAGISKEQLPSELEGGSIASLLTHEGNGKVERKRDELVFHFPHYQSGNTPHSVIVLDGWKLIHFYEDDSVRLFDLSNDISERKDLADREPKRVRAMRERLDAYLVAVDAQMPTPNKDFDPSNPSQQEERQQRQNKGNNSKKNKGGQ
ncbi:MAG: sulfatase [Pirellula sp.]